MTAIPGKSSFTGASVTEGGFKSSLESMHDYLTELLGSDGGRVVSHASVTLSYVTATSVKVAPRDGNKLLVKTSGSWKLREIASAGVTASLASCFLDGTGSSALSASTLYYVYVFDNGGTLTLDFSATGPATDSTTGVQIKTGLDTRTYVGFIVTDAASEVSAYRVYCAFCQDPTAPVDYIDLTNGGADDTASWEFAYPMRAGYGYDVAIDNGSLSATGFITLRLRNDGGTVLTSSGDYIESGECAGQAGVVNESAASFFPFNYSSISTPVAGTVHSYRVNINDPMNASDWTTMLGRVTVHNGASTCLVGHSSCLLPTVDGHKNVLIVATAGNFDGGQARLYEYPL